MPTTSNVMKKPAAVRPLKKKSAAVEPVQLRGYKKSGKFGKAWKKELKDIKPIQLLTALHQLLEKQPTSYQQCARMAYIQKVLDYLDMTTPDAGINHDFTTQLVKKWQEQVADDNKAPTLDQLVRAVLECQDGGIKKTDRSILTTQQKQRKDVWSRKKKDETPTPAMVNRNGKRPPPGQGSYPTFARSNGGQVPDLKDKSMQELCQMSQTFGASAVAYALQKFIEDNDEVVCNMKDLSKQHWFEEFLREPFAPVVLPRANHLLATWKEWLQIGKITAIMVVRAAIVVLRPVERRTKLCGMCSRTLDDDALMRCEHWNPCKHHFCPVALLVVPCQMMVDVACVQRLKTSDDDAPSNKHKKPSHLSRKTIKKN